MTDLLIRNLNESVVADLERAAQSRHTSAEEEARRVLERHAPFDANAWRAGVEALAERIGLLPGPPSTEILRAMRYGGEEH